jgi:hypothetical protein
MLESKKRQTTAAESERSSEQPQETTSTEFSAIEGAYREKWELILGQIQDILAKELPPEDFSGYTVREISFTKSNSVCLPTVYYDPGKKCIVIGRVCFGR